MNTGGRTERTTRKLDPEKQGLPGAESQVEPAEGDRGQQDTQGTALFPDQPGQGRPCFVVAAPPGKGKAQSARPQSTNIVKLCRETPPAAYCGDFTTR